jgi:hypothetical protein
VGDFWYHIDTLELQGRCHVCGVPETLEHIALECDAPGQKLIWDLTREIWSKKYDRFPEMSWGLVLGCNLVKFKTVKGVILPEKGRLFAILVSIAWHQIWNLRTTRVITSPGKIISTTENFNQWLKAVNGALQRDRLLTDRLSFGPLAIKKQLVLNTWSGLLKDEDSPPDNWTHEGFLVGMRPINDRHGIG